MILIIPVLLIAFVALSISTENSTKNEPVSQSEIKAIGFVQGEYKVVELSSIPEPTPKTFKEEPVPGYDQKQNKSVNGFGLDTEKDFLSETADSGSISNSYKVFFGHASSEISIEQRAPLFQMLKCAEKSGFRSLSISGYTSPDGSYRFNKQLAHQRAVTVKKLIESRFDTFNVFIREHETEGGFFKEKLVTIQVN